MEELAFSSMQKAVNDDPAHPKIYSLLNPPRGSVPGGRYAYDNPDALYRTIPISSMYDYEIRGNRVGAGPADVSFSLRSNVNVPTNLAVLAGQDLVVEEDALEVEIRSSDELPEPISEEEIVRKVRTNFEESFPVYGQFLLGQQTLSQPQNIINAPVQQSFGTLATQANSFSHYNLSETDAIVITFNPGNSVYWVVPTTSLWMITDRPGERVESLNNAQAIPNANGTYTIVLSHSDPGVWNWVMASEGGVGTVMSRFQGFTAGSTQDSEIQIWSRVVPLNGVENVFPQDTKWVSQDEREAQLRERFASYDAVRGF
ncbi:hypothetical protein ACET3X_004730 [Alternaria dauci]|uniref:DUF1214 domain-containing protein n=1 Tax=Alternaria dauci TaxID=48095 RepID=A0ABR3UJJ2_9PLEO